jgi:hypothetical protein
VRRKTSAFATQFKPGVIRGPPEPRAGQLGGRVPRGRRGDGSAEAFTPLPGADAYARQYLWFRSSPDSGVTWAEARRLDPAPGQVGFVTAKARAGAGLRVHVVSNLGYFGSSDGGDTWSSVMPEKAGEAIAIDRGPASVVGVEQTSAGNELYHLGIP